MKKKYLVSLGIILSLLVVPFIKLTANAGNPDYLTIKGSDTMVHLVSAWAEKYMDKNKNADVSVTGGGSGTGIAALINGTTDIASASREIKAEEVKAAKAKKLNPKQIVVARDAVSIIVNPKNPVKTLTMDQLAKIYTGVYTTWDKVGGPKRKIVLLSRESSSGTYSFIQEHVLNKKDFATSAKLLPATSGIIQEVETTKDAIGYVGLGYASEAKGKIKEISIKKTNSSAAVLPSEATVRKGTYPISRPLYLYTNNMSKKSVSNFIKFVASPEGQKIVKETGFVTVK